MCFRFDEIQRDLDRLIRHFNLLRSHQDCRSRVQVLMEALGLEEIPEIIPAEEIMGLRQTAERRAGDPGGWKI